MVSSLFKEICTCNHSFNPYADVKYWKVDLILYVFTAWFENLSLLGSQWCDYGTCVVFLGGGHPVLKYMHVHVCILNPGQASIGVVLNCSSVTVH